MPKNCLGWPTSMTNPTTKTLAVSCLSYAQAVLISSRWWAICLPVPTLRVITALISTWLAPMANPKSNHCLPFSPNGCLCAEIPSRAVCNTAWIKSSSVCISWQVCWLPIFILMKSSVSSVRKTTQKQNWWRAMIWPKAKPTRFWIFVCVNWHALKKLSSNVNKVT